MVICSKANSRAVNEEAGATDEKKRPTPCWFATPLCLYKGDLLLHRGIGGSAQANSPPAFPSSFPASGILLCSLRNSTFLISFLSWTIIELHIQHHVNRFFPLGEGLFIESIVDVVAAFLIDHKASFSQHTQMLGDCTLRYTQPVCQGVNTQGTTFEELDNPHSRPN